MIPYLLKLTGQLPVPGATAITFKHVEQGRQTATFEYLYKGRVCAFLLRFVNVLKTLQVCAEISKYLKKCKWNVIIE